MNTAPCKEKVFLGLIITEKGKDEKGEKYARGQKRRDIGAMRWCKREFEFEWLL